MKFYSQFEQDKFLETNVFKGFKNGTFVDVGAHDGVSLNNTLFFEQTHNWNGVNIEPIREVYDKLVNNRPNCINIQCAVSDTDGTSEFICNKGYTEMLSGLKSHYDNRHYNRVNVENTVYGGTTTVVNVETKRLDTICNDHNINHIHYLSIDVEGAEFAVIKSINFDKIFIDVIGFENNYDDNSLPIVDYLESNGYRILHKSLDIFMIHKDSRFN